KRSATTSSGSAPIRGSRCLRRSPVRRKRRRPRRRKSKKSVRKTISQVKRHNRRSSRTIPGGTRMKRFAIVTTACAAVALGMTFNAGSANAGGGTISGTVKYDGTPPTPKTVEVTKDKEVCGLVKHINEDLIVDSGGGIQCRSGSERRQGRPEACHREVRSERMPLRSACAGISRRQH